MKIKHSRLAVAFMGAFLLLAAHSETGKAQYISPGEVRFQTGCEPVDGSTVEGFVTNPGNGILRINGLVSFSFVVGNSTSHPAIQVQATAMIPPGRTMSVARVKLLWNLLPNEVCHLDVSSAAVP